MRTFVIYDRLVETAELIARHPEYPGKHLVISQCLDELSDLFETGQIDHSQHELLRGILNSEDRCAVRI